MTTAVIMMFVASADTPRWLQVCANSNELRWGLTAAYLTVLGLVSAYGLHRYWLVWLYYRTQRKHIKPMKTWDELPRVTVQLPMYNEASVAHRIIDAACALDYPRHLLQIQVLDDSTDNCVELSRERCQYWAGRGVDIEYIHRDNRRGYKAGALENGLKTATGRFVAIFDADFVPNPTFLHEVLDYFTDPNVGMVQTRWDHLNREDSILTRSQAIYLDGHFIIEHTARNRANRWINFNGTAGMWRKDTIVDAGGWQHDTLTEDVDLSYRAQLRGWRFIYLPLVGCPAELPPEINAFKSQQHRWTKGSIQTAKKLLPTLLSSNIPLRIKVEAFFHLTSPMCYLYITLMALLFYPAIYVNMQPFEEGSFAGLLLGASLFALGTVSAAAFYVVSQREREHGLFWTVVQLPVLMGIGIGIAINNARGCLEAIVGHESSFVRTPKYNAQAGNAATNLHASAEDAPKRRRRRFPLPSVKLTMSLVEILMGCYMAECIRMSMQVSSTFVSTPFLFIFAAGYFYVGLGSLWFQIRASWPWFGRLQPA